MKKKVFVSEVEVICPHCGYRADGLDYDMDGVYTCDECEEDFELEIISDGDDIEYHTEVAD